MEPLQILAHLASVGTPPDAPTAFALAVGLEGISDHLTRETLPFLTGGGSQLQFVHGQYGRGKTHFLHTVGEIACRNGFVTAYVDCRMGRSPFKSIRDTYTMIAEAMRVPVTNGDPASAVSVSGVIAHSVVQGNDAEVTARLQRVREAACLSPDYRNLVYAYATACRYDQATPHPGEALSSLLRADPVYGLRLSSLYRAHPHLPRPIGKLGRRNAGVWLRSLLSLPWILGYPGLVVLFDETERGHTFGTRLSLSQQDHLANLRNFVDHMALGAFRGVSIHYAVVEDFIVLARERLEALSQRIERVQLAKSIFGDRPLGNPRAVWVSLDELTRPSPRDACFFERLASGIIDIGRLAGLPDERVPHLRQILYAQSMSYAESIFEGAVREFVKFAAGTVAREVKYGV